MTTAKPEMPASDTPRTGKLLLPSEILLLLKQPGVPAKIAEAICMLGDHARTLERELNAALRALSASPSAQPVAQKELDRVRLVNVPPDEIYTRAWSRAAHELLCRLSPRAEEATGSGMPVAENIAMMLRRIIWQINRTAGDTDLKVLAGKATVLLRQYGLQGDPLRDEAAAPEAMRVNTGSGE